jgi:hypothetical protein
MMLRTLLMAALISVPCLCSELPGRHERGGVAAFVLKYRLAREEGSPYKIETDTLADGQRAVRTLRANAKEWGIDPAKIGFMGFSAGGELAALVSTRYGAGKPDAADPNIIYTTWTQRMGEWMADVGMSTPR